MGERGNFTLFMSAPPPSRHSSALRENTQVATSLTWRRKNGVGVQGSGYSEGCPTEWFLLISLGTLTEVA